MKKFIRSVLFLIIIFIAFVVFLNKVFPHTYSNYVEKYSDMYGVDKNLVYAVIKAESNFDPEAVSHKDAQGLMQITKETAGWCAEKMGLSDYSDDLLTDEETNIKIGVWYLRYLIDNTKSESYAIMSYNAGINKVNSWLEDNILNENDILNLYENIPYEETKNYIRKVIAYKKVYNLLDRWHLTNNMLSANI